MVDFNYFDVIIGSIIIILAIKGFMDGFIKEAFGLAGLIAGVYFASRLAPEAATFIDQKIYHIDNESFLTLLGFLAILVIVWTSATILGAIFSKLNSKSGLGFFDRLLGLIIGGGKYFIIFALIVTALSNIKIVKDTLEEYVQDSVIYPYLVEAGTYLINLDPEMLTFTQKETSKTPTASVSNEANTSSPEAVTPSHSAESNTTLTH